MIDINKLPREGSNIEYFKKGQVIIRDGETACNKMYILLKGSAQVYKNYGEPGEINIAILSQGDFCGEMSLFLNRKRTATVVANEDVTALAVDHTNAYDFFKNQPEAMFSLIQTLCYRLDIANVNMANSYINYKENITSLNLEKSELEVAANVDALTGIFNRRHFMENAGTIADDALNNGRKAFIVMIDLDHFKKINDTYGHQAGDIVLKNVANKVSGSIRSCDLFARYGGEEFILLITGINKETVMELSERIRQNIRKEPVEFENARISVSASLGIAAVSPGNELDKMISFADEALYKAKNEGRDRIVFYEPCGT